LKKFGAYGILMIVIFLGDNKIFSQKKNELEKIRQEKLEEIDKIEKIILDTKNDKNLSLSKINLISKKIEIRNELIDNISVSIDEASKKMDILTQEINLKYQEIEKLKEQYAKIIYSSYYHLKNYNVFIFILSSKNFNQAYRRLYYLREYTNERKQLIEKIGNEIYKYKDIIADLKSDKYKKQELLTSKEKEKENLSKDKLNLKRLIEIYNVKEDNLRKEVKELQEYTKKIEIEIEKLVKEENLAKAKKSKKVTSEELLLTRSFNENKGNLPWPVEEGTILSSFGEHEHPIFKGIIIKNNGIDITTKCNSAIYCVFKGIVSKIFAIKGANFTVIIRHGDFLTVYQNLQKISIKIGENVSAKQIIGYSTCEGENKISYLHFELWQELNKMNPENWLIDQN